MTDNEIIKALGYCKRDAYYTRCNSDCPLRDYCESDEEDEMNICGLALDLINRQKAEIEKLKEQLADARYLNTVAESDGIEEFAKKVLERLDNEALTEFEMYDGYDIQDTKRIVNNLVKEMTEGE